MNVFLYIGSGYLIGVGVMGYTALWAWIKERCLRGYWPPWVGNLLLGIHFVAGVGAIVFVPSFTGHRFRAAQATVGPLLFAATLFALLGVAWWAGLDWNRWFAGKCDRTPGEGS
jgi:hypothetical protein